MSELILLVSPEPAGYLAQGFVGLTDVIVVQAVSLDDLLEQVFREVDRCGPFAQVDAITLKFKLRQPPEPAP